jgi:hypothetical protein
MVSAPASTGRDRSNKIEVMKIDQTNKGNLCIYKPGTLILTIVTIKLIAPARDETPAICKLKIAKSTDGPECDNDPLSGG